MKTNAQVIAQRVADAEFRRGEIVAKAARCLTESIESIKAYAEPEERAALIAESVEQAKVWLKKSFAEDARGDEADDEDRENRIEDDDGENRGSKEFADLGDDDDGDEDGGRKKEKAMDWRGIVKRYGVTAVCKMIADDGDAHGLDEHTLTQLATEYAQKQFPNLSADRAFAKLYESAEGEVLRKAQAVAKMPILVSLMPQASGSVEQQRAAIDDTEASEAYKQLVAIGRQRWPTASEAQQFARAFTGNPDLAAKARFAGWPPKGE